MKANLQLRKQAEYYFGCTLKELDDACWQSIINSNDYYRELRGEITRIEEIKSYVDVDYYVPNTNNKELLKSAKEIIKSKLKEAHPFCDPYDNYGVIPYERNIQICYKMYNDSKHEHPCGTTVFWSSFKGGRLSHGTHPRGVVSFKSKGEWMKDYAPSMGINFEIYRRDLQGTDYWNTSKSALHIYFGGTCATLEDKLKLINYIMKKQNLCFTMSSYYVDEGYDSRHRDHGQSCELFIKELMRGKYIPIIESKEKKIVKLSKLLGTSLNDTLIYKRTYTDGSMAYVRVDNPNKVKSQSPF